MRKKKNLHNPKWKQEYAIELNNVSGIHNRYKQPYDKKETVHL